jgi:hypothetical protein
MSVFFEIRLVSEFLVIFKGHETLMNVGIKINDELLFWIKMRVIEIDKNEVLINQ